MTAGRSYKRSKNEAGTACDHRKYNRADIQAGAGVGETSNNMHIQKGNEQE
ncbi:hypothetical protein P4H65_04550 [Paenibacillus chitinolyticus]|uniref:hypothetical protein n=1 Tax=Paenibacillus chitinolyticus TaxID=79263 RepID=UPI002DB9D640|nr:hypothetical protein [Paenibacillus chitinolyticus]MEC0245060.1 hypothetical protein [Paenibacillus chitinolyticus]